MSHSIPRILSVFTLGHSLRTNKYPKPKPSSPSFGILTRTEPYGARKKKTKTKPGLALVFGVVAPYREFAKTKTKNESRIGFGFDFYRSLGSLFVTKTFFFVILMKLVELQKNDEKPISFRYEKTVRFGNNQKQKQIGDSFWLKPHRKERPYSNATIHLNRHFQTAGLLMVTTRPSQARGRSILQKASKWLLGP